MKKLFASMAGLAALSTGVAQAAPQITYTTQPDGSFSAFFGSAPRVVNFTDLFTTFTVSNPRGGVLYGTLSTGGLSPQADIDFVIAEILGPGGLQIPFSIIKTSLTGKVNNVTTTNPDGIELGSLAGATLAPGTYTLHITGKAFGTRGTGSYAGTLDFIATPAPEPAAWALMILGFGAIGFAMRRQRSAQQYSVSYS